MRAILLWAEEELTLGGSEPESGLRVLRRDEERRVRDMGGRLGKGGRRSRRMRVGSFGNWALEDH